jgi:hypothetical protein
VAEKRGKSRGSRAARYNLGMADGSSIETPSIFALVLFVAILWVVAWFITRRRGGDAAQGRWLRFSVYGIFWLVLASAVLLREWQRAEQQVRDWAKMQQRTAELEQLKLRSDIDQQLLRDRIEDLERTQKNQTPEAGPPGTTAPAAP